MQHHESTGIPPGVWRSQLALLALTLALVLGTLDHEVMDSDPAQYADVAHFIVTSGNWLELRDMNGPFVNKPPLMMQAQALALLATGQGSSVAIRLPAVLFFVLTVLGTWWLGALVKDQQFGLNAAVLVSSSVGLHHMVADPKVDLALTSMVTLAIGSFVAGARGSRWWSVAAWLFTGLAVLAKGPVGIFLVAGAVLVGMVRSRPLRAGWWVHGVGVVVFGLVVTPFYVAMVKSRGEGTLSYLLWSQGPGRVFGGSEFHDSTTPLYVLHTAAWALLPMSPLVVWAWWRRWQRRGTEKHQPFQSVASWWLVATLVGVAAASFKLPQYVYWGAPAAALLAAEVVEHMPRWASAVLAGLATLLAVLVVLVMFPAATGWAWAALAVGVALAPIVTWRSRSRAVALAASTLGFVGLFDWWIHPSLLEYQPSREVAVAVAHEPQATALQLVGTQKSFSLDFYVSIPLVERGEDDVQPGLALVSSEVASHLQDRSSVLGSWPTYRVSLPRWPFLRASTRAQAVSTVTLLRVRDVAR